MSEPSLFLSGMTKSVPTLLGFLISLFHTLFLIERELHAKVLDFHLTLSHRTFAIVSVHGVPSPQ